jgi:hypothetical protein
MYDFSLRKAPEERPAMFPSLRGAALAFSLSLGAFGTDPGGRLS